MSEFGLVIARLIPVLVVIVPATRVLLGRPVLDALLFAVALAVGLTPELLPMITTVTRSRGAMRIAIRKVIVKRHVECLDRGRVANPQRFVCRDELLRNQYRESAADSDPRLEFGVNDEGVVLLLNLVDQLYNAVRATSEQGSLELASTPWRAEDEPHFSDNVLIGPPRRNAMRSRFSIKCMSVSRGASIDYSR